MQLSLTDDKFAIKQKALETCKITAPIQWSTLPFAECLTAARILCADEVDLSEAETFQQPTTMRNEAAALSFLCTHKADICGSSTERQQQLHQLCDSYVQRTAPLAPHCPPSEPVTSTSEEQHPEAYASMRVLQEAGMRSCLLPATLAGGMRGLAAAADVAAGECVLALPAAQLITYKTALESDLGGALSRIPQLDAESAALIWTMVDRSDEDSPLAHFWRALPQQLVTGLSASEEDVALLEGTPVHDELQAARQHMRQQYQVLQPVFRALLAAYPQFLQEQQFSYDSFLWAAQLWYAYAIQVQGADGEVAPALVPYACLINHSARPHIVRFSRVDPTSAELRLCTFRSCAAGEEVCLSYGPLPNGQLLMYYGFALEGNPAETIDLHFEEPEDAEKASLLKAHGLALHHVLSMRRLPRRLLACLRVMVAGRGEVARMASAACSPMDVVSSSNEADVLDLLESLVEGMAGPLISWAGKEEPAAAAAAGGGGSFRQFVGAYMRGQMCIVQHVLQQLQELRGAVPAQQEGAR